MKKSDRGKSNQINSYDAEDLPDSPLKKMGITHPDEITRYTLRQEDDHDVLTIYYKRDCDSYMPAGKVFKFGKTPKTIITDSGKPEYARDKEISPILQAAIAELNKIVKRSDVSFEQKKAIVDELDYLENYMCLRVEDLRTQIEQL